MGQECVRKGELVVNIQYLLRYAANHHHRPAFTLLELLVVTAVIASLAALLLPTLSRAQERAKDVMCRSNLHQLGVELRMYLNHSTGVYPYSESMPDANRRGASFWFDALAGTNPTERWGEGIFKCPAYPGVHYEGEVMVNSSGKLTRVYLPCGSYAYNASGRRLMLTSPSGPVRGGLGFGVCDGQPIQRPVREDALRAPADLYVLGDALTVTGPWGPVPKLRLGGASDYNSLVTDAPLLEQVQHRVLFNMLFADSHVESVRTEVLLSADPAHRAKWNHDHMP